MNLCKRAGYLDIINMYNNNKRLDSPEEVGYFTYKKIINVFQVNRDT